VTNNLEFHSVTLTPDVVHCLHNVLASYRANLQDQPESPERWAREEEATRLYRWLTYVRQSLFLTWQDLPAGDHLKEAYREEVWTWDDQDLASIPEDRLVSPDDLPGSDAVDLQGFRRPTPEEIADG
jgi:hypothetical protein